MFAGEVFWRAGQAASEALESFIETERENESVPQISGTLVELLKRCFQHNPEDRPKDMQEITRKLKEIYQDTVNQEYNREEPKPAELLADGLNNKAVSMLDLGRKEDAEKLYEEALKADPHHPEATYNRGLLLWRSGQMTDDELIRELEEVRTTHTEDWVDEYLLGLVHIERGDAESAVKVLKQVSQQASENNNIRLALKTAQSGLKSWSRCLDILGSHKGRIDVVAISPNSRLALSATYGGERLRMWEIATGKCLIDFNESANSAMYSNDGKYVLSARKWYVESDSSNALAAIIESTNLSIKLWEVNTGKCVRSFEQYTTPGGIQECPVCWSHEGSVTLSACGHKLALWNTATGECLRDFIGHEDIITSIGLSEDGVLALSGDYNGFVKLWDVASGKYLRFFKGHTQKITSVYILKSNRYGLTGSQDGTIKLWDIATGNCLNTFVGHEGSVNSIAISLDARVIVSGGSDSTVRVWETWSGKCIRTFEAKGTIMSVAISHNGDYALSGGYDKELRVYRLHMGQKQNLMICSPASSKEIGNREHKVQSLIQNAEVAIKSGDAKTAYEAIQQARYIPGYERNSDILALRQRLSKTGCVRAFSAGWHVRTLKGHTYSITGVAISGDGRSILSGEGLSGNWGGRSLRLWDLSNGNLLKEFEGHQRDVTSVALSGDSRFALSGAEDAIVKLWDLNSGNCLRSFSQPDRIKAVAFLPNEKYFLSAAKNSVMLLEVDTGNRLWQQVFANGVESLAISPDGGFALVGLGGYKDPRLVMLKLDLGTILKSFNGHSQPVSCLAISLDSRFALSGSWDKTIRLWEIAAGCCIYTFEGHTTEVHSVAFTPDGRFAVSGSRDHDIILLDIENKKLVRSFEGHKHGVDGIGVSSDNRFFVSGSRDKTIRVWELVWDYDFPEPTNWDEKAKPYLEIFLTLHCPYGADGISRVGKPVWNEEDFKKLLTDLQYCGYGWLRPEDVRKKLEEMTANWQGPPPLL